MSYAFRFSIPKHTDLDRSAAVSSTPTHGLDDPVDDQIPPELEILIARLDRVTADQERSRRYMRRSNTVTASFRRHQRRGALSLTPAPSPWSSGRSPR